MFVLNKKRIYLIFSCLIISTMIFQVAGTKSMEIEQTVALPVYNRTIVIDAGHRSEKTEEQ